LDSGYDPGQEDAVTAEAVSLRWRACYGAMTAEGYLHTYLVTKQGRYWAAWMKYRIIHGDDHWKVVPGPFPMTRRQAMANAEAHEAHILSRRRVDA
jgi:hypothetical protein